MPDVPEDVAAPPDEEVPPGGGHPGRPLAPATTAVTAGRPPREPDAPLSTPVVLASTYHAGGEVEYGRYGNPTWASFEVALGALEGGEAVAFGSGMAAVGAVLDRVREGGVVVAPRHAYAGTLGLLRQWAERGRVDVRLVDVADTAAVSAAARGSDLVWVENPTNPALEVADLPAIARAAHAAGAVVAADNTFATPLLRRPLADGADLVVHSATKYLAGHSDAVLGAVVAGPDVARQLREHRSLTGAVPGAMEAYLALRGLRTLHLRVERAQANAAELAGRLLGHPALERVRYPGFGAIVAVEVRGGARGGDALAAAVRLWVHATSLGGVESSLERRRRWSAEAPSIPAGLVRLSVGVEDVEDLWSDLDQALAQVLDQVLAQVPGDAGPAG
jgi:cystathionine gamma-synthase